MKVGDKIQHTVLGLIAIVLRVDTSVIWYELYRSRSTIDNQNKKYWVSIP